jgi:hypothetical protein
MTENNQTTKDILESFTMDIRQKKLELLDMWQKLFNVGTAIIEQAEIDPLSVRASMLAQVVRILAQSQTILKDAEKFRTEIKEDLKKIDHETGEMPDEDEMTAEEQAMVEYLEQMESGINPELAGKTTGEDSDTDTDSKLSFRRDK